MLPLGGKTAKTKIFLDIFKIELQKNLSLGSFTSDGSPILVYDFTES